MATAPTQFDMTDTQPIGQGVPTQFDMTDTTPVDAKAEFSAPSNNTEGLYEMHGPDGPLHVPYSRVMQASKSGFKVTPQVREKYASDRAAEMKKNPKLTEAEFKSMELPEADPQAPGMWQKLESGVRSITAPTNVFPGMPTSLTDPATGEMTLNAIKRAGATLFGMVDFVPQAYGALKDAMSSDPQRSSKGEGELLNMHPANQIYNRAKEVRDDARTDPKLALSNLAGDAAGIYLAGKAGEVIPRGAKGAGEYFTEKLPTRMIEKLIRPSAADIKFGKNPAHAILEEKIVGNSLYEIGERVFDKIHEVGRQIDQKANLPANSAKIVDVTGSLRAIDDAMLEATRNGEPALFKKLNDLKTELTYEWRPVRSPKGKVTLRPVGLRNLRMSPAEALKFKRMVGDKVRWTGNDPFEELVNETAGKVYGGVKDELNAKVPGLKDLNERYANLVGAGKAVERRIPVAERNAHWSLSDIALAGTGHLPVAIARKVAALPAVKTRIARGLYGMGSHPVRPTVLPRRTPGMRPPPPAPPPSGPVRPIATAMAAGQTAGQQQPQKKYAKTYTGPNGHRIGTNDDVRYFDLQTGQQVQ